MYITVIDVGNYDDKTIFVSDIFILVFMTTSCKNKRIQQ